MKHISRISRIIGLLLLVSVLVMACAPTEPVDVMDEPGIIDEEPMPAEEEPMPVEEEPMLTEVEVTMTPSTFEPAMITIAVGTTVTWINTDSLVHTVTSGTRGSATGSFDVTLSPGEVFSHVFDEAGTFEYHCTLHPGMDGTVIVE